MANTDADDNIMMVRSVVAPTTGAHWTGNTLTDPEGSRYIRGTVEVTDGLGTGKPLVGTIESCEFEQTGTMEDLDDGACGVEAYDAFLLGYKASITARFRSADRMPMATDIILLKAPEAAQGMLPIRMVVEPGSKVKWGTRALRMVTFTARIHNSMIRSTLVAGDLRTDASVVSATTESMAFPTGGFGDAPPAEA